MLDTALKEVTGIFDRRFLRNAFFPSLAFWGLSIVVAIAGRGDVLKVAQAWGQQDTTLKVLQTIGFVSGVTFFASFLASQSTALLRIYEGYCDFPGIRGLMKINQRLHRTRLRQLGKKLKMNRQDPSYEKVYLYYPLPTQPGEVLPTSLGNILKNSELYPLDRYNLDAVLIWPRLYHLFPDHFVQAIAAAKTNLDFMLVITTLSGVFAVWSGIYLFVNKADWWLFLLCFWGGSVVAWLCYQGALSSALLYAQQIKTGFDLYRHELIKQLRLPLPSNPDAEILLWEKIQQLLYTAYAPKEWNYIDDDTKKTESA